MFLSPVMISLIAAAFILVVSALLSFRQKLVKSEVRYKILTDNLAAAVIRHDDIGKISWCSPYAEVLSGYAVSEIYAHNRDLFSAHVHEEDREIVRNALAIVATGEPFQYRYRFYHKSGLCLWLEARTVPILDSGSSGFAALSIILDVTAAVNAHLKVEERNRDLNEFTYMLSHDLKTPIVTLRGMLEIVRDEAANPDGQTEPIAQMSKAINRLENLVAGVLELARVSTSEKEFVPVDLSEVINEVIDDYRWQLDKVSAKIVIAHNLPLVLANKTQLYQIFSNLVGNALKYRSDQRVPEITIKLADRPSKRRAFIEVSDNGRGIAPEFQEAIFRPFSRGGETSIEGAGVGLAAVKRIVEKLGGTISVESIVGQGSRFTVDFRRRN